MVEYLLNGNIVIILSRIVIKHIESKLMSKEKGSNIFTAMLFGAITGIAVTLLTTPKSGEEMREELKKKTTDLKDKAKDIPADLEGLLDETKSVYSKASDYLKTIKDKKGDAKVAWEEKAQQAKELLEEQKSKIEDALNAAKDNFKEKTEKKDKAKKEK